MERKFPTKRPIAIDFFCGAGGMSLGFEQAGFDVLLGVDVDGHHVATHERNFPYGKALCGSIVDLDGKAIRQLIGTDRDIDVVVGGPPCQGFSHMGLRDLKDPRNSLIDHFIRMVLELRPKTFVMENVPGLLSGKTRSVLDALVKVASDNGYTITTPVRVLDASHFGVPQQRRRVFVLGVRSDVGHEVSYPAGILSGQPLRPTVLEAISDLPSIEKFERLFSENNAPYSKEPTSHYARVARGLETDPTDLSHPRVWDRSICSGCLRTRHSSTSVALYRATPPGQTVPGHKLPRLHPEGICTTLRAGSDSTHGSYTAPRPIHPKLPRCITSREAARLHGYPDWFDFYPLKWHAYRQIGNSVCPPVARAVGAAIQNVLGGSKTAKEPKPITLHSTFLLPDDRPRTLKRIPQIEQFPPVIAHLVERAFDKAYKKLLRPGFTFSDVQNAISATGVNLHWIREDTFLAEIARSRRVFELLEPAMKRGYSILPVTNSADIGRFVRIGTPGTLEDKASLQVRIEEIHGADMIAIRSVNLNGDGTGVLNILNQRNVQRKLWDADGFSVKLADASKHQRMRQANVYVVSRRRSSTLFAEDTPVITCKAAALPNKARISKVGRENAADSVAVLIAATSKHLVALRFDHCLTNPREVARGAFEIK